MWRHMRLAGSVCIIVAAFMHNLALTFFGLCIQYLGVVGAISSLEDKFEQLTKKEDDDASN